MAIDNQQVEAVFSEAVAQTDPAARSAYLTKACGEDGELRARVEALLASHEAAGAFMSQPAATPATVTADFGTPRVTEGPGTVIGRYKLLQLLGEGGFGSVFMAEQTNPVRRTVALKVIKLGMDTKQVVARFDAERQALALMDHPNVARVLDAGATDSGRPYFVMELVKGVPITRYCDTNSLPTRERLALFVAVCQAVQHAHQKGVIHRDLKPSNILVTSLDGRPVPKVIDFGIAKATSRRLTEQTLFTEARQLVGTPEYMSPEQAEMSGTDVDTRTDVYSLGVLLYELLTGTTPFDPKELRSKAYAEIQRMIREVEPPRPSTRVGSLGAALATVAARRRTEPHRLSQLMRGELDWVAMKAMEKDRTRRYETANGLAMDVTRYLEGDVVLARPPTAGYRLTKFLRRHRRAAVAAALVVLSLAVGLTVALYGLARARDDRDEALHAKAAESEQRRQAGEALVREEAQRSAAQASARRADTVSDFLLEMLGSANPYGTHGKDATVRQVLDRAAERLDAGSLARHPENEAWARLAVGNTYRALGLYDVAARHLGLAAAALERHYGPDSAAFAQGLLAVGTNQRVQAPAEAEATLLRASAIARRLGNNDRDRLLPHVLAVLGMLAHERGDNVTAEARYREAVAICEGHGDRELLLSSVLQNLGNALRDLGRLEEAEATGRRALRIKQKEHGQSHPAVASNLNALGWILAHRGDRARSIELFRESLQIVRKTLGEHHPETLATVEHLKRNLVDAGDFKGAEALLLETHRRVTGEKAAPLQAQERVVEWIADFYAMRREVATAQRWRQELSGLQRRALDERAERLTALLADAPREPGLLAARAQVHGAAGRFPECVRDYTAAIELDPRNRWWWFQRHCAMAYLNDVEGVRRATPEALRRFSVSEDRFAVEQTAKSCLLLADEIHELPRLVAMVDKVLASAPPGDEFLPWFQLTKALAEYRCGEGHYGASVEWAAKARATIRDAVGETAADTIRAMALHRLGRTSEADAALAEAEQSAKQRVPDPAARSLREDGFQDWCFCQLMLREARELLGANIPTPDGAPPAAAQ